MYDGAVLVIQSSISKPENVIGVRQVLQQHENALRKITFEYLHSFYTVFTRFYLENLPTFYINAHDIFVMNYSHISQQLIKLFLHATLRVFSRLFQNGVSKCSYQIEISRNPLLMALDYRK